MKLRAGCQGWNYTDWVTRPGGEYVFFPEGTSQKDTLSLYSRIFDTVEIDSTFYAIPSESTFKSWYERAADGFLFSPKLPREITHSLRLGPDSYSPLELFCERARLLQEKLGMVLVQLPPSFEADRENARKLRSFLKRLPRDITFAVEFRDEAWLVDWTFEELESNGVAFCAVEGEWIARGKMLSSVTRDGDLPLYVRFMGPRDLDRFDKVRRPKDGVIAEWHLELERSGRRVMAYFNNLFEGFAPAGVNKLRALNGEAEADPATLQAQGNLFQ